MCKVVAWVIWILGIIGSIVLGNTFGTPKLYGRGTDFNVVLCITSMFITFIQGALFFGIGEIADRLQENNKYLYTISQSLKDTKVDNDKLSTNTPSVSMKRTSGGKWTCSKCKNSNSSSSISCTNCGEYR